MKPLAITLGDPAGIGSEIVCRALSSIDPSIPLWLFGDWEWARQSPGGEALEAIERTTVVPVDGSARSERLFVDIAFSDGEPLRFGSIEPAYGQAALDSVEAALEAIDIGLCDVMVNAPIHKQSIAAAGSPFAGHTEMLAAHAGLERYAHEFAMIFDSPTLLVALLSVHLPLRDAIRRITEDRVAALAALVDRWFRQFKGRRPKIAAAGLNPHAGEGGIFGSEDEIIRRGVERAREEGLDVTGPLSPDTVFLSATRGRYDVVLAAYHDQGLIPVKTLYFEESVNVTIGLPFLRCSVDHGTAFDIAGRGVADETPMRYAIDWASRYAPRV